MARLPQPGGDNGSWGDILNDFLAQSHTSTGTLKEDSVGSTQLKDDAVVSSSIAPGAITETLLAPGVQTKLNAPATISDGSVQKIKLDNSVQSSLDKADSAMQLADLATKYDKPSDGVPLNDIKKADLDAVYAPRWQANTTYTIGQAVLLPDGTTGTAKSTFTSAATFSVSNWTIATGLSSSAPRVLGLAESFVPLYTVGTAQQRLIQVAFTVPAVPKTLRVRVSGGSVTAASAIGVVFTLADTVSGKVIRNVGRTLPAAVADPIPTLERIIDLPTGPQVIALFSKPAGNVALTWAFAPSPDESPLQLIVEEIAL